MYRLNKEAAIEQYRLNLEKNMKQLDSSISTVGSAKDILTSTQTGWSGNLTRQQIDNLKLMNAKRFLFSYFRSYDFIQNAGVSFDGEPGFDRYYLFYNRPPLEYGNFLRCNDEDYWSDFSGEMNVLPSASFWSDALKDYEAVTLIYRLSKLNGSYLFVHYATDGLLSLFADEDTLSFCRLTVWCGDTPVAVGGAEPQGAFERLSVSSNSLLPVRVELELPGWYLVRNLRPLQYLTAFFLCFLIAVSLVCLFFFAFIADKPYRHLVGELFDAGYVREDPKETDTGEFLVSAVRQLGSKLTDYRQVIDTQRENVRNQILERALYHGLYSEEARAMFARFLPEFPSRWRLALVQFIPDSRSIEPDAIRTVLFEYFRQLSDGIYLFPFDSDAVLAIFPENSGLNVQQELERLCDSYGKQYSISMGYILGDICDSPAMLAGAFQQIEHGVITSHAGAAAARNRNPVIGMHQLWTIYYALQTGDEKTALSALQSAAAPILEKQDSVGAKYSCRALNYFLLQIKLENRVLDDIHIPVFNSKNFQYLFRTEFPACFREICEHINLERASEAKKGNNELVDFINSHYNDPQLDITMVTDHFGISAPTLQKRMNAFAGKTFSAYVEELRMNKARQALQDSDMSVQEIAELVGYANTNSFYKAYRRCFGESPRALRS